MVPGLVRGPMSQALGWPSLPAGLGAAAGALLQREDASAAFLACIEDGRSSSPLSPPRDRRAPGPRLAAEGAGRGCGAHPLLIIGVANLAAARGDAHALPTVAVELETRLRASGRASSASRRHSRSRSRSLSTPPTSNAREALRSVETVIVDEIHALVPTKRGAHLALSLERLEHLRRAEAAAHRPLGHGSGRWTRSARFLGGATVPLVPTENEKRIRGRALAHLLDGTLAPSRLRASRRAHRGARGAKTLRACSASGFPPPLHAEEAGPGRLASTRRRRGVPIAVSETAGEELRYRVRRSVARAKVAAVTIVDAGTRRTLELRIEVPVEDMARIGEPIEIPSGPPRRARSEARSGPPSTHASWTWCASTARRSSSSTAGGLPSGSRRH